MDANSRPIIADDPARFLARRAGWIGFATALGIGLAAAGWYAAEALTLSHYDARAHLVVARRIMDSLTPGWRQIGAVWLPLPHVINAVPIQWDWAYRTGAVATVISVSAMAAGLAALAALVARHARSVTAGVAVAVAILVNPNVLYLQSTPMTEPLLFGLSLGALAATDAWTRRRTPGSQRVAGWLIVLLMLTRYEGWFIGSGLAAAGTWAVWREPTSRLRRLGLLPYPVAAVAGFMALSKATVGAWFVTGGFYEATNPAMGRPLAALAQVLDATVELGGPVLVAAGGVGLAACLWQARRRWAAVLPVTLALAAALPLIAFHAGHPLRVRYMVPLVVAAGALAGSALAQVPGRARAVAALAMLVGTMWVRPPLDREALMLREAQWETPYRVARAPVTAYLEAHWDGTPILASMGSLAHYMQQTSAIGLGIRHFVHEGTGDLWDYAVIEPRRHVRWILVEERAEGGDQLAALAAASPEFLSGFTRVAEGGGVALYARTGSGLAQ